jgi:hypothetical protein
MVEELHDAAEKAELLGRLGEFKELHESGTGYRSPRQPINHINYRGNH